MSLFDKNKNTKGLRVIKTARTVKEINEAAKNGFKPLLKKIEPLDSIQTKYWVLQHIKTNEIAYVGDARALFRLEKSGDYKVVIERTWHYPYQWPNPFAAYLIPEDIKTSERVFLEDLIEDYIGLSWNQGDVFRLLTCEAIWNGTDLEIQYDPSIRHPRIMG